MWSTRDVLLVTATVAILAVVVTILAHRKLNSIVDARVTEKNLGVSPMLGVLGRMRDTGSVPIQAQSEPVVNNTVEVPQVESLPENLVPESLHSAPVVAEAPQGSGIKWTPL